MTAELISAQAFDELFARNLKPDLCIEHVALLPWCEAVLGPTDSPYPLKEAARNFAAETAGFDFLCPDSHCIALTPLFLSLRNRTQARTRLLLIAHAPGAYVMEWILLRPLLVPGDLIIAPSSSAKAVIEFLCPELSKFVRVIPHPMHRLPQEESGKRNCIVSLGRIVKGKLLHRQIEAMAVLRSRGHRLKMEIAGPLSERPSSEPNFYARSLTAKIRRLQLEDHVELLGHIRGDESKAKFISGARLMLNLSVTIEESFGKSVVEALSLGVPVVATRWDGLPETIGPSGELLQVYDARLAVDVTAEQVADAIEHVMDDPPSFEVCQEQANRFLPECVRQTYRSVLEEGLNAAAGGNSVIDSIEAGVLKAAPLSGLLSLTAPLMDFSWREVFAFHVEDCTRIRHYLAGGLVSEPSSGDRLRALLLIGTRAALERFLGGLDYTTLISGEGTALERREHGREFIDRIASAATSRATRNSRLSCLAELCAAGQTEQLWNGLIVMQREGSHSSGFDYLVVEAERQRGNFAGAFQLCIAQDDPRLWGEFAAHRLRQLAHICREWGQPGLALPRLRQWLVQFPDSPDSGPVWLDRCINASRAGNTFLDEARTAFDHARSLIGNSPVLDQVAASLESSD